MINWAELPCGNTAGGPTLLGISRQTTWKADHRRWGRQRGPERRWSPVWMTPEVSAPRHGLEILRDFATGAHPDTAHCALGTKVASSPGDRLWCPTFPTGLKRRSRRTLPQAGAPKPHTAPPLTLPQLDCSPAPWTGRAPGRPSSRAGGTGSLFSLLLLENWRRNL